MRCWCLSARKLWARSRVDHLMQSDWAGLRSGQVNDQLKQQITALGVEYRLLTQFTSFVAVEELVVNEGGQQRTVRVPVEMPEGVSYEGVFVGMNGAAAGLASEPIGVAEGDATPVDNSLQLRGKGAAARHFTWQNPQMNSRGTLNPGQTIVPPGTVLTVR